MGLLFSPITTNYYYMGRVSVYILKSWQEHNPGDIVEVSNNVAFGLIDSGVARKSQQEDFMVKPKTTMPSKTKAYGRPPKKN